MGELGLNVPVLVAQLVNFFILLVILRIFLYRPILDMLDRRSQRIREGEGTLGKLIYDEALYEEAKNTLTEARNLIEDMREQAPISAFISVGGAAF